MQYRYRIVDVFTNEPLEGNPLAVFPDARGIPDSTMQKIAKELNLSETTFVLPSSREDCVAQVRIFNPNAEMLFAGHPTIGTAWVLLQGMASAGDRGEFALEEKIGRVPVRVEQRGDGENRIWLRTPPIREERTFSADVCAEALGLRRQDLLDVPPQRLSAGNPTLFIPLRDAETVDRAWLDGAGMKALREPEKDPFCVLVFAVTADGPYSRMFAPEYGIPEDPASGSAMGPLARYMMLHHLSSSADGTRWTNQQGVKMGRRSLLHVLVHGECGVDGIEVGGCVAPLTEAVMTLG